MTSSQEKPGATVEDLKTANRYLRKMKAVLREQITVKELGVKEKAPFNILCLREALTWRTVELGEAALAALKEDKLAVGITLTRSTTESAALLWYLRGILAKRKPGEGISNDKIVKMIMGTKAKGYSELPKPVHVLDAIREVDETIRGVAEEYDYLSEFAHPNWHGVTLLFSKNDVENLTTRFGSNLRGEKNKADAANLLVGSLEIFRYAYKSISELMPAYLKDCTRFEART